MDCCDTYEIRRGWLVFSPEDERKQDGEGRLERGRTRLPDLSIFSRMAVRPKSISKSPSSSLSPSSPSTALRVKAALVSSYLCLSHPFGQDVSKGDR